jgi:phosphoglycerol transferase MdoB-like AlkP superfamily enzyme
MKDVYPTNGTGPLPHWLIAPLVLFLALSPIAASRVDTAGRHRNAFTALLPVSLPAVAAASEPADWRASPFPSNSRSPDLSWMRGAARGMNVLIVALESTGAAYLRPYGAVEDPMPAVTQLASQAVLFERAYAAYPESIKGLFGVLCSAYPVFGEPAESVARTPCDSVAGSFRAAGYRTALFHSGRFAYLGMDPVVRGRGFDLLEDAGAIGGDLQSSFGVDEPATVDRLLGWIDTLRPDDRFFVSYLPIAGHHPYAVPGDFAQVGRPISGDSSDELSRYKRALRYADAALGSLLDGLHARGLDDRTLVVVFGDHGEAFGQHANNTGHVLFVYDENVHVPLLVRVPGVTETPVRVTSVASLIDLAPTLLDLYGLPAAARHQGRSLLRGGDTMALYLTDYSLGWLGLRDGCWSYQLEVAADRSTLFETCEDPSERSNLAVREPARARAYRERVRQWSNAQLSRSLSE